MYSVEDLLISHGYKLSRDLPAAHEDHHEGRQPARTRARAGLLNGCDHGPAAFPHSTASLGTGRVSDWENDRHPLRVHGEPPSTSAARTSEAGFCHQPMLAWSSQPQSGHSHTYWRRGQEVSGLLGPRDREDLEVRGTAQAHSLPVHTSEGPWEVGGRTEHVMKKAVWEKEIRMEGPAKWQNVSLETWNQPKKLGRQMSDGDREKLFQDLYPFMRGEHALNSQSKGKSRSLPRFLSPESLSCMDIPLSDGHLPGVPKMPLYPPNGAPHLESARNPEKGGSSVPSSRPKFGRPLKPPSYGSHQHSRGGVENSDYLDGQQTDLSVSPVTRTGDPRQELCLPDSGLEPPVYVPPPSYRSPPQHVINPYLEDLAPRPVCDGYRPPIEVAAASCQLPSGPRASGGGLGGSPRSPPSSLPQPRPAPAYDGSVLYIPFDDPRIRHIKLAQPQGYCEETKADEQSYSPGPVSAPEPSPGFVHQDGAVLDPPSSMPLPGSERGPADPSARWLWGQLPREGENGGFPDQREHCVMRGQCPDMRGGQHGRAESHISSPHPRGESTCETWTKLKTFETGIQPKKSSKKKMNETIFCLVSIPVKSESHLPALDTNNNDLKQRAEGRQAVDKGTALQEQSLLSTSSTDLELQALTGSMAGRTEFPKQGLGQPEEDRQTDDLRFIHPPKHRELKYSGSWPGHQYKDQQTQTTFTEEPKSLQPPADERSGGSLHAVLTPKSPRPPASDAQMHRALASSDPHQRPGAHPLKGHLSLNPSSYSAFSRTSSSLNQAPGPKAGQSPACVDGCGLGGSPVPRGDVVKGATTGPCNSQQLFGQFLLKPVSRRPWDLISQLESFNKELQEEEESSPSSSRSEDSETEWQAEGRADSTPRGVGFRGDSRERRTEELPRRSVPEERECSSGRVKSKSESWSEEPRPATHHWGARPPSPGPSPAGDSSGGAWLSARGNLLLEKRNQDVEKRIKELAISPGPVKRMISSGSSVIKLVSPSDPAEPREPQGKQGRPSVSGFMELSEATPLKAGGGEERGTVVPLSLASKPRGLSAPDLRSVGLTLAREPSADKLDGPSGEGSAIEIPPHESLQARAVRILGIEVAVESLLPGTRRTGQSHHPEPDGSARRSVSPREEPVSNPAQPGEPAVSADAFYGRRKCGWTESPLFVGERDSARRAPWASECSGGDGVASSKAPEPQPGTSDSKPFDHKDVGTKPPFRSTLFHFIERTPSGAGSQRLRSTSKVIESLQEKLASPARRADPDRLMRMKEVSSVSRMRLLSSRSSDSMEEVREPKAERGSGAPPGDLVSLPARDLAWKEEDGLPVSGGALSWEENGHLAAGAEKRNVDPDFWCPDSYDPSRVERV